jgi:hypothetical protein
MHQIVVSDPIQGWRERRPAIPPSPRCADCDAALAEPFGWCGGCRKAYCFGCGRRHYCTPQCPANGCIAGLCVRVVSGGILSETWGLPDD